MAWRAIYCEPRREFLAKRELELERPALGGPIAARVFLPHDVKLVPHKLRPDTEEPVEVKSPYFPGYIFAETDQIKAAEDCRGVIRVLKHGTGEPMSVSSRDIRRLSDIADSAGALSWSDTTKLSHDFCGDVGDIFEFISGGFRGRCGKIASLMDLDSRGKVSVLIQAFGSEQEIQVSHRAIGSIISRPVGSGPERVGRCAKPLYPKGQLAA